MLPPSLLIVSLVIFLTTVSTAPVEETEHEVESEATEEVEEELSEEEDGAPGPEFTITSATAAGGSASSGHSEGRGPQDGMTGSSPAGSPGSSSGSAGSAGSVSVELPAISAGHAHPGAEHPPAASHTEMNGSDGVDSESNDVLGSFGGGVSHLDYTEIIDPSSHDYLLGLINGGLVDPFGADSHVNIPGQETPPPHLDSTAISSDVTAAPSAVQNILDPPADSVHHFAISIDQSGPDRASLSSGPDQSPSGSISGPSHSAAASSSPDPAAHRELTDGADSPDTNGNGRQTLLTGFNGAVTDRLASFHDLQSLQTEITGGPKSVTSLHIDHTALDVQLGHDVTESSPIVLGTDSVAGVTHTLSPVSDVSSHTDLVTVPADSTGTETVTADPTGTPFDSSHPAGTDHTHTAGSVTEQYRYSPPGPGPEGAENVDLEDTC
ncbi:uncharacterized protein si:ch211-80h18.1 isoform X2 [Cololabis saira]|uniref:uncharacterized protein si:ch211-80h18.1 isoform X2 n=1 Tax=Cololabis saira TaxID=129043 RepID=UPI002AD3710A|nr:uncharacterized protein si:ch211-80h18.1 isoform X2 [Cololabis saira]